MAMKLGVSHYGESVDGGRLRTARLEQYPKKKGGGEQTRGCSTLHLWTFTISSHLVLLV